MIDLVFCGLVLVAVVTEFLQKHFPQVDFFFIFILFMQYLTICTWSNDSPSSCLKNTLSNETEGKDGFCYKVFAGLKTFLICLIVLLGVTRAPG